MAKKTQILGPSLDTDQHGDPIAEGFGEKLSRDLEIEAEMIGLDTLAPSRVRKVWAKEKSRSKRRPR